MDIKIGDLVRTQETARENRYQNWRVKCRLLTRLVLHNEVSGEHLSVPEKDLILPYDTYEYGGPLGTGIRITNPEIHAWPLCGHPTFKNFLREWSDLINSTSSEEGSDLYDPHGHAIWWAAIYGGYKDQGNQLVGRHAKAYDAFLERWKVRPVPRRLIEQDCLVWWPAVNQNGSQRFECFERARLHDWSCPTCCKPAQEWDQNKAYLQYCSEDCYNGDGDGDDTKEELTYLQYRSRGESNMIDADDAFHKMERHCEALEHEVRRLENVNFMGNQELTETKNKLAETKAELIEISKAKSAMHQRAQKAEGALKKGEEKQLKLANSLAGATELYRKAQSERDKNRNTCVRLQQEIEELKIKLIEAESPRAFMEKVEAVRQARGQGVEVQGQKSVERQPILKARLHEAQLCSREERIDRLESENKQLRAALRSVPKEKERVGWAKQINARNARIAELELVVQDLSKQEAQVQAPVTIAQAKYTAIQTAVRAGATVGSLYFLLQYLMS